MAKRMLIDATHPEETRVVVLNGTRLEEFDFETSTKRQIKGNIYLAKVTRVEPSLQAAFVEYGGNRHGFLAFSEIHPDYYQIPVSDREAMVAAEKEAAARDDRELEEMSAPRKVAFSPESDPAQHDTHDAAASMASDEGLTAETTYDRYESGESETDTGDMGETGDASSHDEEAPSEYVHDHAGDETASHEHEHDHGTAEAPSHDDAAPVAAHEGFVDTHEDAGVEVVGGDDIEEAQQRSRVHYRNYKIQEVIKRRQILLVQVTKEERGNKGAALTTYLSLAGRYCVLMPNAGRGGGVSRKITSLADRRRLKELMEELDVPEGMGVIVRTAGSERPKAEIHRDYEYLLRLWDDIRDLTLRSSAPAFIYEEGSLIKRAIRDLYNRDIDEINVEGEEGYKTAKEFMRMLMPGHVARVKPYRDPVVPLLHRYQVDAQIDQIHNPTVQLRSGGYIVINPTEALVAIDVNSGRSTKERNIEETATKTNLEAAEEIARQLRLRDLAGLIVIDFIDMEESRNRGAVERRLKDAMKHDRARIQLGRISPFGLLEMSRQRLRSSLIEASTQVCPHCNGTGTIRSTESTALVVLRALEEEGIRQRTAEITLHVPTGIALYILNQKRDALVRIEQRYGFKVLIQQDDTLVPPAYRLDKLRAFTPAEITALSEQAPSLPAFEEEEEEDVVIEETVETAAEDDEGAEAAAMPGAATAADANSDEKRGRRRRRRRRGRSQAPNGQAGEALEAESAEGEEGEAEEGEESAAEAVSPVETVETPRGDNGAGDHRRRRGRRGGRRRGREPGAPAEEVGEIGEAEDFLGYPPAIDFARDGREHLFDDDGIEITPPAVAPAPVVEAASYTAPVAETVAAPVEAPVSDTAVAEETASDDKPKRRRVSRRKPAAEASTEDAQAAVAEPTEATPAPKPRRSRRAATAPEAPAVETVVAAAPEPAAETIYIPVEAAPEPVTPEPAIDSAPALPEAVSVEPPAAAPEPETAPEPAPEPVPAAPPGPRRSGWWRRLVE